MTKLEQIMELGFARIDARVEAVIERHTEMEDQNKWLPLEPFLEKHLGKLQDYDEL